MVVPLAEQAYREWVPGRVQLVVSSTWRSAIVVVSVCGLLLGSNAVEYFTIQSNILVVVYFVVAVFGGAGRPGWAPAPRLRGAIASYILLTGFIYHFVLQNGANPIPGLFTHDEGQAIGNWSQFLLHYVIPLMVLIDWIAWGPRRRVRWIDGLLWALYPLGYIFVILVRGTALPAVPDRYPYPFLDPTTVGWDGVASGALNATIFYLIIVAVLIGVDRLMSFAENRRPVRTHQADTE